MFVSKEDIVNLLENNFSFLIASENDVKKSLKEAVLTSHNKDELRRNVLQKIRNHFDMYDSYFPTSTLSSGNIKIGGLNKIGVKDINEEDIEKILENLSADDDSIDEWKKKWNKEEKDIRDLQVLIDLEDMLKDLNNIEEFLNEGYDSIEKFVNQTLECKSLFLEVAEKYQRLIFDKKINKKLYGLSDEISEKIKVVSDKINNNINFAINTYQEEINDLNDRLSLLNDKSSKYDSFRGKIKEIEEIIADRDLDYERVMNNQIRVNEMASFLKKATSKIKKIDRDSERANKLAEKLCDLLERESVNKFLGNFDMNSLERFDKYNNWSYLFILFVKVLYDDGLIDYVDELEEIDDENIIEYEEYKNRFLSEKAKKVCDEIYFIYKNNLEVKDELLVRILTYLDGFNVETENICKLSEAFSTFEELVLKQKRESNFEVALFDNVKMLKDKCNDVDIIKITEDIEKLKNNISLFIKRMEELKNQQIKK